MKLLISIVAALVLCGCMSQQDGTVIASGVQDLQQEYLALSDGFEQIAQQSLDDEDGKKSLLIQRIRDSRKTYGMISSQLLSTISSVSSVQWDSLYNQIAASFWAIKNKGGE